MFVNTIREFVASYPIISIPLAIVVAFLLYRLTRYILARVSYWVAFRTETIYDDLMVDALYPFRVAWLVPLILFYYLAEFAYAELPIIKDIVLFLIILAVVDFSISALSGINDIYEHQPRYTGTPIAGYIGLLKVLAVILGVVLVISIFSDLPPAVLLGGVGAWLAVLLLIFRDTILAFVASVQISTQQLVKDGDWIEVPSYNVNGFITGISLNSVTVRNLNNTITMIPTHKIVDVAVINNRGWDDGGGRQINKSFPFDVNSIGFCDTALLKNLRKYDLIADVVNDQIEKIRENQLETTEPVDFLLDGPQVTNLDLFMKYVSAYLSRRKDLVKRRLPTIIRISESGPKGIVVQILAFTKATGSIEHFATCDEIIIHLIAVAPDFGLRAFQEKSDAISNPAP